MHIRFSPLLATGTRTMVPTLVLFSLYVLVIGHDQPGGGFAGGLIGSAALLLIYLAFGDRGVRRALRIDPAIIAGIGLGAAVAAGLIGWVTEGTLLSAASVAFDVPAIGTIKLTSVLLFDAGVYLVVVGLVGSAIVQLGAEVER